MCRVYKSISDLKRSVIFVSILYDSGVIKICLFGFSYLRLRQISTGFEVAAGYALDEIGDFFLHRISVVKLFKEFNVGYTLYTMIVSKNAVKN